MHTGNTVFQNLAYQWMILGIFWHEFQMNPHFMHNTNVKMWRQKALLLNYKIFCTLQYQKTPQKPLTLSTGLLKHLIVCAQQTIAWEAHLLQQMWGRVSVLLSEHCKTWFPGEEAPGLGHSGAGGTRLQQLSKRTQIRTLCMHKNGVSHQPVHAFICNYSWLRLQS